jgi:two-component system, OmpR family, response regulator ResD
MAHYRFLTNRSLAANVLRIIGVKSHILVVDDESSVREVVSRYLEREGFEVSCAATGPEALTIIDSERDIQLVVLDVMLPGLDGFEIVRRVRENNGVPIIMLSARSDEADRVVGLESGADDYIPKPFSPRELVSRVKAVLRRAPAKADENITREKALIVGAVTLDPNTREVGVDARPVELTAKEFELLWFFMRHPRQVFSREQLLEQVWGFAEFIDISTVTVHIHRLRDKIECDPKKPARLTTVWGVGYRLVE